jgi:drug/metabolite transporter (DMT)-like permease
MSRRSATLVGFTAILMWAALALLSKGAGAIPPFQLAAMTFFIGALLGMASWPSRPHVLGTLMRQPARVWLLSVASLFGYHFLYFTAIQNAPPVEVSLIAYLWPLLLVVFSALLPGERIRLHHLAGVALGMAGAFLVITKGAGLSLSQGLQTGHLLAVPCAIIWAAYSVLSKRFGDVPTDAVAGFCLASAALSLACHLLLETTVWPHGAVQWLAVAGLGLAPLGAAFYTWDFGLKRGDVMALGALSYASPLLSTLLLVGAGVAQYHWSVLAACLLITAGALIASRDLLFRPKPS